MWTILTEFLGGLVQDVLHLHLHENYLYTLNHKKRDILFLTITLANFRRFL